MKKIRVGKIGKAARQHGLAALQTIALQNLRILGLVSAVDIVDLISEKMLGRAGNIRSDTDP